MYSHKLDVIKYGRDVTVNISKTNTQNWMWNRSGETETWEQWQKKKKKKETNNQTKFIENQAKWNRILAITKWIKFGIFVFSNCVILSFSYSPIIFSEYRPFVLFDSNQMNC